MISLDDLMNLVNPPKDVDVESIDSYIFYPELFESRLVVRREEGVWFVSKGVGFNWGIRLDWGEKDYLRKFLLEINDAFAKVGKMRLKDFIEKFGLPFSEEEFVECYQSIPRLQYDKKILEKIEEETEKLFERGYSSFLPYVMFRVYVNKLSRPSQTLFQKALNKAADMVYLPFETWRGWRKNQEDIDRRLQYYELDEDVRRFADSIRDDVVRKCCSFLSSFYSEAYQVIGR